MLFLLLFVGQNAWSAVVASGDLTSTITWKVEKLSGVSKLTVSGTGEMPDYTSFTAVPWADLRNTISILEIGDGITNIGNYAFNGIAITKVAIPSSCKKIGMYAFYGCKKMTDIYIPASVVTIGTSAVSNCSKLGFVHYDDRCSSRTALNLSSCAKTGRLIEKSGTGDSYANVPEGWEYYTHGVQCYGGAWVAENTDQTKLFFYAQNPGATVNFAVEGRVPSSTRRLDPEYHPWRANCSKYTSLEIDKNIASIDDFEFLGYEDSDVTKMGYTNMQTITVSNNNSYFVVGEDGALYDKSKTTVYLYPAKSTATNIEIPATVTTIRPGAFYGAKNLQKIDFLGTISLINTYAFAQTSSLNCLSFATETAPATTVSTAFTGVARGGVVFASVETDAFKIFTSQIGSGWTFDGETYGPAKSYISDGTLYVVGKGEYTTSSSDADWYSQRSSINRIVIKGGITNIGSKAFAYCSNVTEVTLNNNGYIDYYAFLNCSALTRVNVGSGVTEFKEYRYTSLTHYYPFEGCSKLATINVTDLAKYCSIEGLNYLTDSYYGTAAEKTLMVNGAAHSSTSELVIPEGVTSIPNEAFRYFSNVTKIKLPKSLETISDVNFWGYTYLTEITVPSTVSSVGSGAFRDCTALKTAILNNNGDSGWGVFEGCKALQTATLNNNGSVESSAFERCISLQTVTLNNNGYIDYRAFWNCIALTRINIGSGVTEFKEYHYSGTATGTTHYYPFEGCSKLATINVTDLKAFCAIKGLDYLTNSSYGTAENKTLMVNGVTLSSTSELVIPEGVKKISEFAFYNFANLTKIKIPTTTTSVGRLAFGGCTNLERIICLATTCPSTDDKVATDQGNITLKVPGGKASLYNATNVWKEFNVVEGELKTYNWTMFTNQNTTLSIPYNANVLSWSESDESAVIRNGNKITTNDFVYDGTITQPYKMSTITAVFENCDMYVWNIKVYPREVTLTDGDAYKNNTTFTPDRVSYTRTYAEKYANHLQCFYVPFDVKVTDELLEDFTFYELYMVSQKDENGNGEIEEDEPLVMVLTKIPSGDVMQANMPYYIKPKAESTLTVTAENATLYAATNGSVSCSTTKNEYTLTGINEPTNIKGYYTMSAKGNFSYYTKDTNLGSYRWYMSVRNRRGSGAELENYARPIQIVIDGEEDTTGIVALQDKASDPKNDKIYTLDGRQVTDYETLPSGIYIINGKKVYKK